MVCADVEMVAPADITSIARHVAQAQVRQIAAGIRQVRERLGPDAPRVAILAGRGSFLAKAAARRVGLETCDLADHVGWEAARVAPAAAVAYLLAQRASV